MGPIAQFVQKLVQFAGLYGFIGAVAGALVAWAADALFFHGLTPENAALVSLFGLFAGVLVQAERG